MIVFVYTFIIVVIALFMILGIGSLLSGESAGDIQEIEGEKTAAMCTTRLLDRSDLKEAYAIDDFVIEQDLVFTYDSFNL